MSAADCVFRYRQGDRPPQPRRNIQNFWANHCEDEWQRAFYMFSSSAAPGSLPCSLRAACAWPAFCCYPCLRCRCLALASATGDRRLPA